MLESTLHHNWMFLAGLRWLSGRSQKAKARDTRFAAVSVARASAQCERETPRRRCVGCVAASRRPTQPRPSAPCCWVLLPPPSRARGTRGHHAVAVFNARERASPLPPLACRPGVPWPARPAVAVTSAGKICFGPCWRLLALLFPGSRQPLLPRDPRIYSNKNK